MRYIFWIFFMAVLLGRAGAAIASPPQVEGAGTQRRLTLEQAVELAIRANLEVAIERLNVDTADAAVRAARGSFDPVLRWEPSFGNFNTPVASVLQGPGGLLSQHSSGQTLALQQKTGWNGLALDAEFGNSRVTSSNPFQSLSPFYSSQLSFTVTQPLLRGRRIDGERAEIRIRAKERDASTAQLEIRAIDVIARMKQVYWDLVAARRQSEVAAEAVHLAKVQLEQIRRMIAAGALPAVELAAAEAESQSRLDDLYRCAGAVTEFENSLKTLLAHSRDEGLWNEEIVPADSGAVAPPAAIEIKEAMAMALRLRPELRVIEAEQAVVSVQTKQDADLIRPQLNLVASYSLSGLAGNVRPGVNPIVPVLPTPAPLPGAQAGGLGSSFSSLFGGNYQTIQAGITFVITGRNRTAKANLAADVIAEKRLGLMRLRTEQIIQAQVRNAFQALETAIQRIQAAAASTKAALVKLESETRLFATGESTNFLVLTRQNEYSAARRRQVDAEAAFNKAVAQYETALGTALASHGLRVE